MLGEWAGWQEIRKWALIASGVAAVMLIGVTVSGYLLPGDPEAAAHSRLLTPAAKLARSPLDNIGWIFTSNFLVLCLHYCCCLIAVIVSTPHRPLPEPWARYRIARALHRPVPEWMGRMSLAYGVAVTLFSIALQTTELGFVVADLSARTQLPPLELVLLMSPHGPLELTAIFLPLGLFLLQARRRDLRSLRQRANQAFLIGMGVLVIAAAIEVLATPHLVEWWLSR